MLPCSVGSTLVGVPLFLCGMSCSTCVGQRGTWLTFVHAFGAPQVNFVVWAVVAACMCSFWRMVVGSWPSRRSSMLFCVWWTTIAQVGRQATNKQYILCTFVRSKYGSGNAIMDVWADLRPWSMLVLRFGVDNKTIFLSPMKRKQHLRFKIHNPRRHMPI